jgi:hypothetical protein
MQAANRLPIVLLIGLLGTTVSPSDSWSQETPASATFQASMGRPRSDGSLAPPWTVTFDSDGVRAVRPAVAWKHPELRLMIRFSDFPECAFLDNRDGRYKPGFPIWSWYSLSQNSRRALISAGSDKRNSARKGDTLWVRKKPSRFSSPSTGF